jgi:hypothetical protein
METSHLTSLRQFRTLFPNITIKDRSFQRTSLQMYTSNQLSRQAVCFAADSSGILQMLGCGWTVFQLGHCGYITRIEVDTYHFKGNYPDSIRIEGATDKPHAGWRHATWHTLLPPQKVCRQQYGQTAHMFHTSKVTGTIS